jgi:hypothetical protein
MKTTLLILFLIGAQAQITPAPSANPSPPPSAPAQKSAAEIEKLVAPIALYPDPLIATILPASVYPLEIVQAARFVQDTNNLAKLDQQPWDDNVKAVARVPQVIKKMNDDLSWTTDLGLAFLAQQQQVMETVQSLRAKAQKDDYIINRNMIGGFALIAWPAEYGNSGVMTFTVNQQGKVYQKDLGPETASKAKSMKHYDPDDTWKVSTE